VFQAECGGQKIWPMINDMKWLGKIFIRRCKSAARDHRGRGLFLCGKRGERPQ